MEQLVTEPGVCSIWSMMRSRKGFSRLRLGKTPVKTAGTAWCVVHVKNDEQRAKMTEHIVLKRLGTTDDIAYAVVFLASEQASYITGTVLNVSGGLYT